MTEDQAFGVVMTIARALITNHKLPVASVVRVLVRCADELEQA